MLHVVKDKTKLFVVCCIIAVTLFWVKASINPYTGTILVKATIDSSKSTTTAAAVPATVVATVPTTVAAAVPTTVAATVPATVAATVPATVAATVPATVAATVPTTVAATVPTTAAATVPTPQAKSENLCYPSNRRSFPRDHLPTVNVSTFDPRSIYVTGSDLSPILHQSNNYKNLTDFIEITSTAILSRRLLPSTHSIGLLFSNPPFKDLVQPSCDGLWMEFGVFRGGSVTAAANWKKNFCGEDSEPVYGFDTFTGLPTDWRPGFGTGAFVIPNETNITVPSNVVLVKGLFIDTLPTQLGLIDRVHRCHTPVSYVHIDCDIYDGARDVLFLLGSRLVKGSIIVFDELFNYPAYEKHEIKALFEFLSGFNIRLKAWGSSGEINLKPAHDLAPQSFGFIVD